MSASQVDPHNNMRARDVSKVTRGEQAPRPAHEYGTVSPPPPPSATDHINVNTNKNKHENLGIPQTDDYQTRHCYVKYVDYHRWLYIYSLHHNKHCFDFWLYLMDFNHYYWFFFFASSGASCRRAKRTLNVRSLESIIGPTVLPSWWLFIV